ncbi:hypothetical protein SNOG_09511 [Parastagonospora nodorum SN15]|uniref:Uncharacterized protein n=1 Tax=Phaeosphaeria nodorum (strain SN15 / ATCC MYA-4574 / FGSC 10173) TaxID=321614 RepID=Q0UFF3_PHANO|nr:hypothetical protein SNOG_09511 [Parastagonospora nodorum SN15]EAT82776.1 hypothetical protein SNOG_09511 [Parastagonospora nodorum SN15]
MSHLVGREYAFAILLSILPGAFCHVTGKCRSSCEGACLPAAVIADDPLHGH